MPSGVRRITININGIEKDFKIPEQTNASFWFPSGEGIALTLAAIPKVPNLVLGLALTDMQERYIRAGLVSIGLLILTVVGWFLFFRTLGKLRSFEKQLRDSLASPHKVTDDYEHLKDRGFWVHRKTGQRVCGSCLLPPNSIESPLFAGSMKNFYQQAIGGPAIAYFWKCGRKDCEKVYPRPENEI
jgi:hypothetical protein